MRVVFYFWFDQRAAHFLGTTFTSHTHIKRHTDIQTQTLHRGCTCLTLGTYSLINFALRFIFMRCCVFVSDSVSKVFTSSSGWCHPFQMTRRKISPRSKSHFMTLVISFNYFSALTAKWAITSEHSCIYQDCCLSKVQRFFVFFGVIIHSDSITDFTVMRQWQTCAFFLFLSISDYMR